MNKTIASLGTAVITGAVLLTSIVPANAQWNFSQRKQVIETYCDRNPGDSDCRGYYGGGWDDNDYNDFYGRRRGSLDSIATGVFGFAAGAIVGGALANSNNNSGQRVIQLQGSDYDAHVAACYNRYRSYDEESNTFLGYDGLRHQCTL
jgi:hypothetical protein